MKEYRGTIVSREPLGPKICAYGDLTVSTKAGKKRLHPPSGMRFGWGAPGIHAHAMAEVILRDLLGDTHQVQRLKTRFAWRLIIPANSGSEFYLSEDIARKTIESIGSIEVDDLHKQQTMAAQAVTPIAFESGIGPGGVAIEWTSGAAPKANLPKRPEPAVEIPAPKVKPKKKLRRNRRKVHGTISRKKGKTARHPPNRRR